MGRRMLPPSYFATALVLMVGLHFLLPGSQLWDGPIRYLGVIPVLIGAWLAVAPSMHFDRIGTTVKPFEESRVLVVTGVFAWSRNPMYLGMVSILLGLWIVLGSLVPLLVVPVFAWLLRKRFIEREEWELRGRFGDEYVAYTARVRRWIGRR
jgi:protein-S-isoprenylcysteine O-methyltransferase Ste14